MVTDEWKVVSSHYSELVLPEYYRLSISRVSLKITERRTNVFYGFKVVSAWYTYWKSNKHTSENTW